MSKKDEPKEVGVLDQVKKLEKIKKAQILVEAIEEIKRMAKDVLETKEKTKVILEEIGLSEADIKAVIDYVNSLVKLTESDKKRIREEAIEVKEEKEEVVTEKIKKSPFPQVGMSYTLTTGDSKIDYSDYKVADLSALESQVYYSSTSDQNYSVNLNNGYEIKL